jgi:phosphoadenosine phosphosulfate reductase
LENDIGGNRNMPEAVVTREELKALENRSPEEILSWAYDTFGKRVALASSFGAEGVVVMDLIAKTVPGLRVFTLDTGRLHDETYDVMERIRRRYGTEIEVYFPDQQKVETLALGKGFFSFRESIENRKECCGIRKVEPLKRALSTVDAWVTGLRREQAITRVRLEKGDIDEAFGGIVKLNPIAEWTQEQVWDYIRTHDVPYNLLHDRGFPSIGCAPCTRAISPGEDVRAGRWWWELPEQKECGLHVKES